MRFVFVLGLTFGVFAQAQTPAAPKPAAPAANTVTPTATRPAVTTPVATPGKPVAAKPAVAADQKPTIADVRVWLDKAEKSLLDMSVESGRMQWIAATYITDDTELLSAQ